MDWLTYLKQMAWLAGGVAAIFYATEKATTTVHQKALGKKLAETNPSEWLKETPMQVNLIFTEIFGEKHITWRCFGRSAFLSIVFFFISLTVVSLVNNWFTSDTLQGWLNLLQHGNRADPQDFLPFVFPWWFFCLIIILVLFTNIFADFLSLLETRIFMRWLLGDANVIKIGFVLVCDLVATFLIFFIVFSIIFAFLAALTTRNVYAVLWSLLMPFEMFLGLLSADSADQSDLADKYISVAFYGSLLTTFVTSVWIWLFMLVTFLYKVFGKVVGPAYNKLRWGFLNLREKPYVALAWIGGAAVVVLHLLIAPAVFLL